MRFPLLLCFLLLMVQCCLAEPLKREELAGRNVAIWQPVKTSKAPIVIFSHGFHGINSQSAHLMGVLAKAGYFVVAPNHGDYLFNKDGANSAPQQSFDSPEKWTEDTYRDRANDLAEIFSALKAHPVYKDAFDPGTACANGTLAGWLHHLGHFRRLAKLESSRDAAAGDRLLFALSESVFDQQEFESFVGTGDVSRRHTRQLHQS
jgi:hypothetical protein